MVKLRIVHGLVFTLLGHLDVAAFSLMPTESWSRLPTLVGKHQRIALLRAKLDGNKESLASDDRSNEPKQQQQETELVQESRIKIDDGGSDLTDRFKYKVQALMGNFDPADATQDTEEHTGNILSAVMTFPTTYTFHAVGKHGGGDDATKQEFCDSVKSIVRHGAGLRDDATVPVRITPRTNKFVKVSVTVTVESGAMITEIYEQLGALDACVMQF